MRRNGRLTKQNTLPITRSFYIFSRRLRLVILPSMCGKHITLTKVIYYFFHSCTVHLDTIKFFYTPTNAQWSCSKKILKFTLEQLLHVSVQSPSSGSVLFELC